MSSRRKQRQRRTLPNSFLAELYGAERTPIGTLPSLWTEMILLWLPSAASEHRSRQPQCEYSLSRECRTACSRMTLRFARFDFHVVLRKGVSAWGRRFPPGTRASPMKRNFSALATSVQRPRPHSHRALSEAIGLILLGWGRKWELRIGGGQPKSQFVKWYAWWTLITVRGVVPFRKIVTKVSC